MVFKGLTKKDTSALKGFAILCIVFHNFFHHLDPSPGENEFLFSPNTVHGFFSLIGEQPSEFINIIFSYLGHFGVQIFILLSGYGLAISMLKHGKDWTTFMVDRLKKLYPLLLTGIIVLMLFKIVDEATFFGQSEWTETMYKLLFVGNLIPNSGLSLNGPWWFFGLIFELYLLFPLLFSCIKRYGWKAFAAICVVSYTLIFLFRNVFDLFHGEILMMNAPGHLPEFCLGILLAFHKGVKIHPAWLLLAIAIFCLGNFYAVFYPFTFLAVSVILLFAFQRLKTLPHKKGWLADTMVYFGEISMILFAVHGFFRETFLNLKTSFDGFWSHALVFFLFFITVWGVSLAAKQLYECLIRLFGLIKIRESKASHIVGIVLQSAFGLLGIYLIGYFIFLNVNKFDKEMENYELKPSETIVTPDTEYGSLGRLNFDKNIANFKIDCSFDMTSQDTLASLPYIVFDISGMLWDRLVIPESFNTPECNRYQFSYEYTRPFNRNLVGKTLKIYLWNPSKSSMEAKNINLSIKY